MGVFAKVVLAIAILVANGVLLFVVLRFLLWLAFPGQSADAEATAARAIATTSAAAAADAGTDLASAEAGPRPPRWSPKRRAHCPCSRRSRGGVRGPTRTGC